jgi:hypothetical protein
MATTPGVSLWHPPPKGGNALVVADGAAGPGKPEIVVESLEIVFQPIDHSGHRLLADGATGPRTGNAPFEWVIHLQPGSYLAQQNVYSENVGHFNG